MTSSDERAEAIQILIRRCQSENIPIPSILQPKSRDVHDDGALAAATAAPKKTVSIQGGDGSQAPARSPGKVVRINSMDMNMDMGDQNHHQQLDVIYEPISKSGSSHDGTTYRSPIAATSAIQSLSKQQQQQQKGMLHRSTSMPVQSPSSSSIFYRNKDLSKSSRSIRFDLQQEDMEGDGDESDDDDDDDDDDHHVGSITHEEKGWPNKYDSLGETQPLLSLPKHEKGAGGTLKVSPSQFPGIHEYEQETLSVPEEERRCARIAAAFLNDYTFSQAPTLPPGPRNVTNLHLRLHAVRFSDYWRMIMIFATGCLFVGSCFEGSDGDENWATYDENYLIERIRRKERIIAFCTVVPVVAYAVDILMMATLFAKRPSIEAPMDDGGSQYFVSDVNNGDGNKSSIGERRSLSAERRKAQTSIKVRKSRQWWWAVPVCIFLVALSIETFVVLRSHSIMQRRRIWASVFKPVVFFYVSSKTRNTLDAINRVIRVVVRVIAIELFLIFTFGAVAVQLYGDFDSFEGLPVSFLSMFQLSTTVVNPSLWMPVVNKVGRSASIFFVIFLITSVFYLHSLVLSVVFQSYMDGLAVIREHAELDREKNLQLAYDTLCEKDEETENTDVPTRRIRSAMILMRPHYNAVKTNALMNVIDPLHNGSVDYDMFRLKVPKALNISVHSKRPYNNLSRLLELFAAFVALLNLVYVVLASSKFHASWWDFALVPIGFFITLLCIIELVARLVAVKILRVADAAAAGKPNLTFDGLATVAAVISIVGLSLCGIDYKRALDRIFTGRAIDMIRCLRLNAEARGIVKRSSEVIPALLGPVLLIVAAMHIFVHVGIAIWGGQVVVGSNLALTPFYDLNNFNSYLSGAITLFQVLVINDWHAIAEVFILPDYATNALVYPFFISANLVLTSVLLNVMIAFFVNAFVTKATDKNMLIGADHFGRKRKSIIHSESLLSRSSSVAASDQSPLLVTISERQGFDSILRTIAGEEDEDDSARLCSHALEIFEAISLSKEKVGYLVSCHKSKNRYGNQRMMNLVQQFMDARTMHRVVGEMAIELTNAPKGHAITTIKRTFHLPDKSSALEVRASLLEDDMSLFVARMISLSKGGSSNDD